MRRMPESNDHTEAELKSCFPLMIKSISGRVFQESEDLPDQTSSVSIAKNLSHGMMATSDDVITMRFTLETLVADFRIPTVPLIAGLIRSRS